MTPPRPLDHPGQVVLHVGETFSLDLPGLGTAGYLWSGELLGPPGVVNVAWSRGSPEGIPSPVGLGAAETVTIQAQTPGQVTLHLVQRRPWERDKQPLSHRTVQVTVVGDD